MASRLCLQSSTKRALFLNKTPSLLHSPLFQRSQSLLTSNPKQIILQQQLSRLFSSSSSSSSSSFSFNNNNGNSFMERKFKEIIPPNPSSTIIEPEIRSGPFRVGSNRRKLQRQQKSVGSSSASLLNPPRRIKVKSNATSKVTAAAATSENTINNTNNINNQNAFIPVKAVHAAQNINLASVVSSKFFTNKTNRKMMERLSVVMELTPAATNNNGPNNRFIVVYRFGSIVFFNISPREISEFLQQIKTHYATGPVSNGFERKENFCVYIQQSYPDLYNDQQQQDQQHEQQSSSIDMDTMATTTTTTIMDQQEVVTGEYCIVQELNMKSVDVISNIMAQSVALDSYNDTVDQLLANFATINGSVKDNANLTTVQRDSLFRSVALNNSIFIDMVSKLGIKDRSDTAWNLSQYEAVHYGMKEEFEINLRFQHIEFKLNLIQQNAKFFLEVLNHQKSNSLEWIIIVLITFECVLMCMEMSGAGTVMFDAISNMIGLSAASSSSLSMPQPPVPPTSPSPPVNPPS